MRMVFIGVLAWIGLFFLESLSHGTAAAPNYNILMIPSTVCGRLSVVTTTQLLRRCTSTNWRSAR